MMSKNFISGKVYLLGDNIDTDQILTAEYLKVNPSTPEGYEWLGKLAMCGLPIDAKKFRDSDGTPLYSIIIAGENFGCGSSREHAVIALGAAGIKLVIAKSFARIFFRNSIVLAKSCQ
jgi:3-isopropylmalate/(R)-2-methylmalate dehydratase small subunit